MPGRKKERLLSFNSPSREGQESHKQWIVESGNLLFYLSLFNKGDPTLKLPRTERVPVPVKPSPSHNMLDGIAQYALVGGPAPASNPERRKERVEQKKVAREEQAATAAVPSAASVAAAAELEAFSSQVDCAWHFSRGSFGT